jgi:hypothetical protein
VTLGQLYHLSTGITLYISRSTVLSGNDITRPSVRTARCFNDSALIHNAVAGEAFQPH